MFQKLVERGNMLLESAMKKWLLISCGFSCLLLAARIVVTGYPTYLFMTWNLFLAIIPYVISEWLANSPQMLGNKNRLLFFLLVWLLFVPNTFYIITDLFHLDRFDAAPKWFDLLLIYSFAWNGLVLGLLSVSRVENIMMMLLGRPFSLLLVYLVMWLNAFGVYIGRYLRFNSWDILVQPFSFFNEVFDILFHPVSNRMEWGMITVYAIFMTLCYVAVKKIGEGRALPPITKSKSE